jgi:hypothetical protein
MRPVIVQMQSTDNYLYHTSIIHNYYMLLLADKHYEVRIQRDNLEVWREVASVLLSYCGHPIGCAE